MGLSLVNNTTSLAAQNSLNKTNGSLSRSLEKLSSGLKVNRGADGPAALVISEQQRAQISGLRAAIDNTNKAIAVVQTGEGALNEINGLLSKVRALAIDSANSGVNDTNALAANQAEITNSLDTISRIANTTKFGAKNLLNGQAGVTGTVSGANNAGLGAIQAGINAGAGTKSVAITTQGTGGTITAAAAGAGSLAAAGSVTVSGGGLTSGQSLTVALAVGDNTAAAVTKIQSALDNASAVGGGPGKFVVDLDAGAIRIRSNILGSAAVTVASDSAGTAGVTGFAVGAGQTGTVGAALVATVDGASTSVSAGSNGLNNTVNFGGAEGLTFTINVVNGATALAAGSATLVNVNDQSLSFQIGANAGETAKISFDKVTADVLGSGVAGSSAANLSLINVTTTQGAQDAIKVIDSAINQVSNLRGKLGAFQSNTLESNANNLKTTLENTTAAESVVRDTDFATEIANFTKFQTQLQAGTTVLGNANQLTQLVAGLLKG